MDGILKVTPERLMSASDEFAGESNMLRNLTNEMISLVESLKGIWQGEAANAYGARFLSLKEDMDKLYRMIAEHSKDLSEMASGYLQAEGGNSEQSGALRVGVVS